MDSILNQTPERQIEKKTLDKYIAILTEIEKKKGSYTSYDIYT
jgi:hypothetical protein